MARRTRLSGSRRPYLAAIKLATSLALWLCSVGQGQAHLLNMTQAELRLDTQTGRATLVLDIDLLRTLGSTDAYRQFAQALPASDSPELWEELAGAIDVRQKERRLSFAFVDARPPAPFDPKAFDDPFRWPKVQIVLGSQGYDPSLPLQARFTRDFVFEEPIALSIRSDTAKLSRWLITDQPGPVFSPPGSGGQFVAEHRLSAPALVNTFGVGFAHILPGGIDHLLFVLAVLLFCRSRRSAVILVTAFTLGHSLSLAVAAFKLVSVPATIVEPLILLSIVGYGLLALFKGGAGVGHHFGLVLLVGLLHGLGFAAAFSQLEWSGAPWAHLLSFNLGIEAAQLLFVLCAYPLLKRYHSLVEKPLAVLLVIAPFAFLPSVL